MPMAKRGTHSGDTGPSTHNGKVRVSMKQQLIAKVMGDCMAVKGLDEASKALVALSPNEAQAALEAHPELGVHLHRYAGSVVERIDKHASISLEASMYLMERLDRMRGYEGRSVTNNNVAVQINLDSARESAKNLVREVEAAKSKTAQAAHPEPDTKQSDS